jgi:hypothetical protein
VLLAETREERGERREERGERRGKRFEEFEYFLEGILGDLGSQTLDLLWTWDFGTGTWDASVA